MVKADAYGHGSIEVSRMLIEEGVTSLGVALVEEGIELREAGIHGCEILVFYPAIDEAQALALLNHELTPVVSTWSSLMTLQKVVRQAQRKISVHLKFNTGITRLGFSCGEAQRLHDFFKSSADFQLKGICSHLLSAEDYGLPNSRTAEQMNLFRGLIGIFSDFSISAHILNSAGLLALHAHAENGFSFGARPGLSLYGVKPSLQNQTRRVQENWEKIQLKPVMQIQSEIAMIQKISKGETVSYGGLFRSERDSVIGVVPIGYADGYPRHFSCVGRMLCQGREAHVAGIVCMDFTMLDLTEHREPARGWVGEEVVILGDQLSQRVTAEELGEKINTNAYEILTRFSARVPRIYE